MTIEEYLKQYPEAESYRAYLMGGNVSGAQVEGMLQFNEETACVWGGPFPGGFAEYHIKDYSKIPYYGNPTMSLAHANSEYFKSSSQKRRYIDFPTLEKPVSLHLSGNDDTSYSKFFATIEEAVAELRLLEACQPLDFFKDFDLLDPDNNPEGGWVFTN